MDYLRRPIMGPEGPKTVVDIYVKKQEEYTKAQIEWDNIQDKNAGTLNYDSVRYYG